MMNRSMTQFLVLVAFFSFQLIGALPKAPRANSYELPKACKGGTYREFMDATITPKLKALSKELIGSNGRPLMKNDDALEKGKGVSVKLDDDNYNFHINYPNNKQGGRSYGWSHDNVGDWSDKTYLDELEEVVSNNKADLNGFYTTIVQMLGNCDTSGLSFLSPNEQQVANNFLAIYTAEQYRAAINGSRWDDALFEVTMLGAFHGGQDQLTKFYEGEFSSEAVDQVDCAYHGRSKTDKKFRSAQMNDYWQFGRSVQPDAKGKCRGTSGINPTRKDFEAMGKAITEFEREAKSKTLKKIEAVVGKGPNAIRKISEYFTKNQASSTEADELATNVAKFLVEINEHADNITTSLLH